MPLLRLPAETVILVSHGGFSKDKPSQIQDKDDNYKKRCAAFAKVANQKPNETDQAYTLRYEAHEAQLLLDQVAAKDRVDTKLRTGLAKYAATTKKFLEFAKKNSVLPVNGAPSAGQLFDVTTHYTSDANFRW